LSVAIVLQNMAILYRETEKEKQAAILEERIEIIQRKNQQQLSGKFF
jgi:hypothetical protein